MSTHGDDTRAGHLERRRNLIPPPSVVLPGVLLGIGLGGFVDGIVLHQLLQWHHLLSSSGTATIDIGTYPVDTVLGLEVNTLWDGLFHAVSWVAVLAGLAVLYGRVTRARGRVWSARALWGWVILGWGVFNLVEGVLNHHVLQIHHVRSGEHEMLYDLGFLAFGAVLVLGGWLVQRGASVVGDRRRPTAVPPR